MLNLRQLMFAFSMFIAALSYAASNPSTSDSLQSRVPRGSEDVVDACVTSTDTCLGSPPDCADLCGAPYCPGYLPYCNGDPPLYVCCPRGTTLDYDPDRGVLICSGMILDCPDPP
jgi:hypothetical protein